MKKKFNLLLPIAGEAQRFKVAGYDAPNPLIMAKDKHVIEWAMEAIKTEATLALKESELRGRLENDKIGALKSVFQNRLRDTKRSDDREERLKALIRLHKELDI